MNALHLDAAPVGSGVLLLEPLLDLEQLVGEGDLVVDALDGDVQFTQVGLAVAEFLLAVAS